MTPEEILRTIEVDILDNIARNVSSGNIESARWQIKKLADLGRVNKVNEKIISKYIKQLDASLQKELIDDVGKYAEQIDTIFQESSTVAGALPLSSSASLRNIFEAAEKSKSSLINLLANSMLSGADEVYSNIVTVTAMENLAGVKTGQQALAETLRQWGEKGLPGLTDSAGRTWQPDTYARMEITTAKTNAYTEICFSQCDAYGNDLIQISSHIGARPLCALDQGRIFSRSGNSSKYPAWSTSTYGKAAGLFGVNCGHYALPFIEGVSEQSFKPYGEKENERAYENSQRQRELERKIRAAKRQQSMMKNNLQKGEATQKQLDKATQLVKNRQSAMREFINDTGRTRRYNREKIY